MTVAELRAALSRYADDDTVVVYEKAQTWRIAPRPVTTFLYGDGSGAYYDRPPAPTKRPKPERVVTL